jgi:large subunit ribosomal protein L9
MKVILQQDIEKVGRDGEVVTVADGYARNYLFPRKLAVEAVGGALKNVQMRQALEERRSEKLRTTAEQARTQLEGKTVAITARAGAGDRLYGSITAQDIAEAIRAKLGVTVDKRKVQLKDPVKTMGRHTVAVKLHRDITVPVTVEVVREAAA